MISTSLLTFDEALNSAKSCKKHLLLGNGFSIAWKEGIFQYNALLEQADFSTLSSSSREAFSALETVDFELVMKSLRDASKLVNVYSQDKSLAERMKTDSEKLKEVLVQTIAKHHPSSPQDLTDEEYKSARKFLSNFDGNIFSLNYDLLLYWVLMHEEDELVIESDDGFRSPEEEASYVIWDTSGSNSPRVFFLHGALHLFDAGYEIQKFTWKRTGKKLIDQIREALNAGLFPLIVSEGESVQKLTRISHSDYLSKGKRCFGELPAIKGGESSLFIFGHSLADNDDHILNLIPESKVNKVFVGIFGSTESEQHLFKISKIEKLIEKRKEILREIRSRGKKTSKKDLEFYFYDAKTANIWRNN